MKHAYLIMAHDNFELLNKLLLMLDYPGNDIYLHVDKKATDFKLNDLPKLSESKLELIDRIDTNWGGYSLVQCELNLLKSSVKGNYDYYHLLSGVDLPIKNQRQIHDFFEKNKGYEFVGFVDHWDKDIIIKKIPFIEVGRKRDLISCIKHRINKMSILFQRMLNKKPKFDFELFKGSQWFSTTNDFAKFVLDSEFLIKKNFSNIQASDEMVIQTILANSKFKDNIYLGTNANEYESSMRNIDWNRGTPYTYKDNDFEELVQSNKLFARKFGEPDGVLIADRFIKMWKEDIN